VLAKCESCELTVVRESSITGLFLASKGMLDYLLNVAFILTKAIVSKTKTAKKVDLDDSKFDSSIDIIARIVQWDLFTAKTRH
jgi:hypothetical protein